MTCCYIGQFDEDEDVQEVYTDEIAVYEPTRRPAYEAGYWAFPVEEQPYGYPPPPYGYPPQPYGYPPAPYGYPDPYAAAYGMPAAPGAATAAYSDCAGRFPPGTPQSLIDAVCGMAAGATPSAETVSQAADTLAQQGMDRALEAFLRRLRQDPNYSDGAPTPSDIARGCKPVTFQGRTVGKMCPPKPAAAYAEPLPRDPKKCAEELAKIRDKCRDVAALAGRGGKLTDEQKALLARCTQLQSCAKRYAQQVTGSPGAQQSRIRDWAMRLLERAAQALGVGKFGASHPYAKLYKHLKSGKQVFVIDDNMRRSFDQKVAAWERQPVSDKKQAETLLRQFATLLAQALRVRI